MLVRIGGGDPEVLADRRFRSANRWPAGLPGFRDEVVGYCEAAEQLVRKLVRLYDHPLVLRFPEPQPDDFARKT